MILELTEDEFNKIIELIEPKCSQEFGIDLNNPYDAMKTRFLFQHGSQVSNKTSEVGE